MTKKVIAVILAISFIGVIFSSCTSKSDGEKTTNPSDNTVTVATDDENFKLSYTQSDSLDPFKAKTQNNQALSTLVFESLFDLDENFTATPNIAASYEYENGTTLNVTLNNNLSFSDGSPITAEDIEYSFNAAKKSPGYESNLKGISSVNAQSANVISFNLNYENPYAQNLLNFPIASTKDTSDGYPIGSGRYSYKNTSRGLTLTVNKSSKFTPHITTIHLVNIAASDSIDNAVNIGNISYAFRDMSTNTALRMTSSKKQANINNLVYIGINSKIGITSNASIREAISLAIDRNAVAKSAYSGYAVAATSIFNPAFGLAKDTAIFPSTTDSSAAKQAIVQSKIDSKKLSLVLLVDKNSNKKAAASLIKNQLETVGFKVTIDERTHKEYKNVIQNENFSLYIGETKLATDMNLYPFLKSSGSLKYGINTSSVTAKNYKGYMSGDKELGDFLLAFSEQVPFIPVVYKYGMICYSKSLKGDMQGYYGNYFSNIEDWYFE